MNITEIIPKISTIASQKSATILSDCPNDRLASTKEKPMRVIPKKIIKYSILLRVSSRKVLSAILNIENMLVR